MLCSAHAVPLHWPAKRPASFGLRLNNRLGSCSLVTMATGKRARRNKKPSGFRRHRCYLTPCPVPRTCPLAVQIFLQMTRPETFYNLKHNEPVRSTIKNCYLSTIIFIRYINRITGHNLSIHSVNLYIWLSFSYLLNPSFDELHTTTQNPRESCMEREVAQVRTLHGLGEILYF